MATISVDSSRPADPMREAVAEMFSAFARFFGARWDKQFNDAHARPAWYAALRKAGLTPALVRQGMADASQLVWPPSTGEFIELCRPKVPELAVAVEQAATWARGQQVAWSHPTVAAAAQDVGSWKLRTLDMRDRDRVFAAAYRQMVDRFHRGEDLEQPTTLAIGKPEHRPAPEGSTVVAEEIRKCRSLFGLAS